MMVENADGGLGEHLLNFVIQLLAALAGLYGFLQVLEDLHDVGPSRLLLVRRLLVDGDGPAGIRKVTAAGGAEVQDVQLAILGGAAAARWSAPSAAGEGVPV